MDVKRIKRGTYRFYQFKIKGRDIDLPAVTTILTLLPKPRIVLWAVLQTIKFLVKKGNLEKETVSQGYSFHKQLLSSLADEGTNIHDIIEAYLTKGTESSHDALKRFRDFERQSGYKSEAVEVVVWSEDEDYQSAGTADLIGSCHGLPIVLDIKTSKAIRLSHKIQACIYRDLYEKVTGKAGYSSGVILIPRDKRQKWELHINTPEEEAQYRLIYKLLSGLFHLLYGMDELDLT